MFKELSGSIREAEFFFQAKNFGASDLICRALLVNSDDAWKSALLMLGDLSLIAGRERDAHAYKTASRSLSINDATNDLNTYSQGKQHPVTNYDSKRFLIATGRGYGFWSEVSHFLGCALLSEITNRHLIIHWDKNSLYSDGEYNDCFRHFFYPANQFSVAEMTEGRATIRSQINNILISIRDVDYFSDIFPAFCSEKQVIVCNGFIALPSVQSWSKSVFWPDEDALGKEWKRLAVKYLSLRPNIKNTIDKFILRQFQGCPYAAVHIRGSDKIYESSDLNLTNQAIIELAAKIPETYRIFLLTDDAGYAEAALQRLGSRICMSQATRSNSLNGVHNLTPPPPPAAGEQWGNGNELALEILLDTYLAINSSFFLGNGRSNVSCAVSLLGNFEKRHVNLLHGNQLSKIIDWNGLLSR